MGMHYNLQCLDKPASEVFASRFVLPLWNYIVPPPKPEDVPYVGRYNFAALPLSGFLTAYSPQVGDTLELFWLRRRVRFLGFEFKITAAAPGLIIQPVTNSGVLFDAIDAGQISANSYAVNGGLLNAATELETHAIVIDDPDYLGLELGGSIAGLGSLDFTITLIVSEQFSAYDFDNSTAE
jgi:hypothetical protein